MRAKPTSACANTLIYYIIIVVNFLRVSVTFCGLLQGSGFTKDILQRQPNLRRNTTRKMATKGDRNMHDVYNECNVINSHIFIFNFWFYSHKD